MYLKTIGNARILLHKSDELGNIISNNQSASGYINIDDIFIFTTGEFIQLFGGLSELKEIFDHKNPHTIIDEITPQLKSKDDQGVIALLAQFNKHELSTITKTHEQKELGQDENNQSEVDEPMFISHVKPWESIINSVKNLYVKTTYDASGARRKKTLTLALVVVLCFIFIWSVILGYHRRTDALSQKKIETTKEIVTQKLNQVDDVVYLNMSRALNLIREARKEVEKLKQQVGNKKEITELNTIITNKENTVTKKEEKNYEEFYDLTVDNKQATGNAFYLDNDTVAILDQKQGFMYALSLTKKSLTKKFFSEIKLASTIAAYQNEYLFLMKDGIYKIDTDGKLKKEIDKDPDWKNITGFWVYNGNLYLLDSGNNEIYKYLVAENGYSAKTSYFKGGSTALKEAHSLAIDSSVYVGFSDHIFKFTSGSQDDFKTSYPEGSISLIKIYTSKDVEKVYAWNKSKGALYILGKNGTYEREINSSILVQANDFIVYNNSAYILFGSKIYRISLE